MKILITGGHVTPALAVIDRMRGGPDRENTSILYVGRKYALDSEDTYSLEYKEITKRNIPFISLLAGRMTRILSVRSLKNFLKTPAGFIHAFLILISEKPDAILSFGGYIALPVAVAGRVLGIPVYTHEQTIRPGLTNRIIASFSRKFFYSFPEVRDLVKVRNAVLTGNPVRPAVSEVREKPFDITKTGPVLYITGGSLGSHSINVHVRELLGELLKDYTVIHQVGAVKEYNDYEKLSRMRRSLPDDLKARYFPVEHLLDDQIGYVYSLADLVVGRSGANTFFELIQLKIPAVFIPLPWSANKEQQKHAEFFVKYGIGELFEQRENSGKLLETVRKVFKDIGRYRRNFDTLPFQIKRDAADIIIQEIRKA